MRRAWLLSGCAAAALAAWPVTMSAIGARTQAAGTSQCASLGEAAKYGIFSNGVFNASRPEGTSISGRIAAAGDVTLGNISVGPSSGDASPTLITAGNLNLGGNYGSLNGGARYQGTYTPSQSFSVNPAPVQGAPGFSFATEFQKLNELSAYWATLSNTTGVTISPPSGPNQPLSMTGTQPGVNVFNVKSADMAQAAGIIVTLTQANATALINISGTAALTIDAQYFTLNGVAAERLVWNFAQVPQLTVNRGLGWSGLILAPNADVYAANGAQINGSIVAKSFPVARWVVSRRATEACLPPPGPPPTPTDPDLELSPLCVDGAGNLNMRLRNTGDNRRTIHWSDLTGSAYGDFVIPRHSDYFFHVPGGGATSLIRVTTLQDTKAESRGTSVKCKGDITVEKRTEGDAPAGTKWAIRVTDGDNGAFDQTVQLGAGESADLTVPGGYQVGDAPINKVVGGILYTITEDDPKGALTVEAVPNPVQIFDGEHELVTVTNTFASGGDGGGGGGDGGGGDGGDGGGGSVTPPQPVLPPGAPDLPPGPDLESAASTEGGTDLAITHEVDPARVRVGGLVETVSRVRNVGALPAVGTVAREIPQYRLAAANAVARVVSVTTTKGVCTSRRPVRCALGTLAPGEEVTIRSSTRVLLAADFRPVVYVSSQTPETNTTNNTAAARVSAYRPAPLLHLRVSAQPLARVGGRVSYRVSVTGGAPSGATLVRVCSRPPSGLVQVKAPGTFNRQGSRCRNVVVLPNGRTVAFTVTGVAARGGRLTAPGVATAVGLADPRRASALIRVLGPSACAAAVKAC